MTLSATYQEINQPVAAHLVSEVLICHFLNGANTVIDWSEWLPELQRLDVSTQQRSCNSWSTDILLSSHTLSLIWMPIARPSCMRILLITIFRISIYMDIRYFFIYRSSSSKYSICIFRYMRTLFTIFKISHYVFIEILKLEISLCMYFEIFSCKNYCICSQHDIQIFLWLRRKLQYQTVIHEMAHIYITDCSYNI
jgi:hypothetical protein